MASVDDILGPGPSQTAEDILGPAPAGAPPLPDPWYREPVRFGSDIVAGLVGDLGVPGSMSAMERGALRPYIGDTASSILAPNLPTTQQILSATGLDQRDNFLAPRTPAEARVSAALRGVGGAMPLLPISGPGAALPTLAAGGVGGVSSELAGEAGFGPFGQTVAGIAGGGLAGGAATALTRLGNLFRGALTPTGEAFTSSGVPMRTPAFTSERPSTLKYVSPSASNIDAANNDIRTLGHAIAERQGVLPTLQEVGTYAQNAARNWLATTMPAKNQAAWAPVDAAIPAATPVDLTNFEGTLRTIVAKPGSLKPLDTLLRPALPEKLLGALTAVKGAQQLGAGPTTWAEVRNLRTSIGDAMGTPSVVEEIGPSNMNRLYAAITADLKSAATNVGPAARDLFDQANAETTRLSNFAKDTISRFVKKPVPTAGEPDPEAAAGSFLSATATRRGATPLQDLATELPDVAREFGSMNLRQMLGTDKPGILPDKPASGTFVRSWESMSPEAKAALYPDPAARRSLDSLYTVAKKVSQAKPGAPLMQGHALEVTAGTLFGEHLGLLASYLLGHHGIGTEAAAGAGSAIIGGTLPLAKGLASRLVDNPLAARYAATQPPGFAFPGQVPSAAFLGSQSNLLAPQGQQ